MSFGSPAEMKTSASFISGREISSLLWTTVVGLRERRWRQWRQASPLKWLCDYERSLFLPPSLLGVHVKPRGSAPILQSFFQTLTLLRKIWWAFSSFQVCLFIKLTPANEKPSSKSQTAIWKNRKMTRTHSAIKCHRIDQEVTERQLLSTLVEETSPVLPSEAPDSIFLYSWLRLVRRKSVWITCQQGTLKLLKRLSWILDPFQNVKVSLPKKKLCAFIRANCQKPNYWKHTRVRRARRGVRTQRYLNLF